MNNKEHGQVPVVGADERRELLGRQQPGHHLAGRVARQGVDETYVSGHGEPGQVAPHVLAYLIGVELRARAERDPRREPLPELPVGYARHRHLAYLW